MIDDSFYFGVEEDEGGPHGPDSFPVTYPFSATVPHIGLALLKVSRRRRQQQQQQSGDQAWHLGFRPLCLPVAQSVVKFNHVMCAGVWRRMHVERAVLLPYVPALSK